jgi:hypothetical protein
MLVRALATLSYLVPCLCKVYEDVADLPGLSYDFVIIGGTPQKIFFFVILNLILCKVEPLGMWSQTVSLKTQIFLC